MEFEKATKYLALRCAIQLTSKSLNCMFEKHDGRKSKKEKVQCFKC